MARAVSSGGRSREITKMGGKRQAVFLTIENMGAKDLVGSESERGGRPGSIEERADQVFTARYLECGMRNTEATGRLLVSVSLSMFRSFHQRYHPSWSSVRAFFSLVGGRSSGLPSTHHLPSIFVIEG